MGAPKRLGASVYVGAGFSFPFYLFPTTFFAMDRERSRAKLIHEGFIFVFDKSSKDGLKEFWRCNQKNLNCKVWLFYKKSIAWISGASSCSCRHRSDYKLDRQPFSSI